MNKKLLLLTTTLILFAYIGKAYAEDLTVTCDNTSGCEMTPSPGDALFGAGESDNTNILPGYTSRRTIYLINDRAEMCNLILGNVTNVVLGPETPITFPYQLWTAMVEGGNVFYGGLFGGQADNTRSLGDLFDGGLLPITTIPAGGSKDVEWLVKFDPAAENEYQDAMTQFDFDMHFMCDDTREVFTVEKFTSAWPAGQLPGTTISYTITIHVLGDPIDDVIVTDLSPEFFAYLTGSWAASSSIKGNLANMGMTEPTYASPGQWNIGDLNAGETVLLTYNAKIKSNTTDGIYPDLAFATGHRQGVEGLTYAEAVDSGFEINGGVIDDIFVGTQVKVNTTPPVEEKKVEVKVEEIEEEREVEGDVLGTSDQRLPATGASTLLGLGSLLVAIISGGLLILFPLWEKRRRGLIHVIGVLLATFVISISGNTVHALTNDLVLRVSEPETPTNQPFNVDFVALEINNLPVNITCSLKKPDVGTYTDISTKTLASGGDSGLCKISEALLTSKGTYYVTVKANSTPFNSTESTVSVYYDGDAPSTPKWIEKDKKSDCKYEVTFKTANDGQTSYVEVYRSDSKEFTINASTRIQTINVGPDEEYSFTHDLYGSDCGKSYYAVRAFDDAGNYSGVRVEEVEDIVIKEIIVGGSTETSEEIGEASAEIEGAISAPAITEAELTPESEISPEGEVVLGEETEESVKEGTTEETEVLGTEDSGFPWIWLFLAVLIGGFIGTKIRKKTKNDQPFNQES